MLMLLDVVLSIYVLYVVAAGDDNVCCAKPSTRVVCRLAQMLYCECWRSSTKLSVSRRVQCVNQLLCLSRPMHISRLQVSKPCKLNIWSTRVNKPAKQV